jgi:putative ABC transport system permease protein
MRSLRAWRSRVLGFIAPNRGEREFADELQSHLEHHIDDNLRAGMTPDEARRRALAKLGSVAGVREAHRDRRGLPVVESLMQDVRYALRGMRRQPSFAAACIATLALGIGANSAIFSVVNGVLFAPLPYDQPERLASIWIRNPELKTDATALSAPDLIELKRMLQSADLEALQANVIPSNVIVSGETVPAQGVLMTTGMFRLLGRTPLLGRPLQASDGANAIVLSHAFWRRQFAADPAVIGKVVGSGRRAITIVGVMPPDFLFPYPSMLRASVSFTGSSEVDFWAVMPDAIVPDSDPNGVMNRNTRVFAVVARMKEGVGLETLRADVDVAWRQLAQAFPDTNAGWRPEIVPLHEQAVGAVRKQLLLLLGSVAIVLIVACVNVTNLLLARGVARQRELALRSALGAGRGRLLQQVVVESVTLSLLGALAGMLIARWATPLLVNFAPAGTPRLAEVSTNWTVAVFAAAIATACGVLVGLVPGFGAARATVRQALDTGGRGSTGGRRRLRDVLVATQVALAVVLAVGAGLLTRSFTAVLATDPGFKVDRLLTMAINAPGQYDTAAKRVGLYERLFARLEAVPGVIAVGGTTRLPLGGANSSTQVAEAGNEPPEGQWPEVDFRRAVHRYFEAMGIPLRSGRFFTDGDRDGAAPVVILNDALAQRMFGSRDPIGRQIRLGPSSPVRQATVIGVVGDLRHQRLDVAPRPEVYVNYLQAVPVAPFLVLRTSGEPGAMSASIRAAVREVEPSILPSNIKTMEELRSASVTPRIFLMVLIGVFGGLALALAAIGVYGVLSLAVAERMREMGIRLALGASPKELMALVMSRAAALTVSGLTVGIGLALALSPLVGSQLYGVRALDPPTLASVVAALLVVSLLASAIPARRVLRVDPAKTLRCD